MARDEESIRKGACFFSSAAETYIFTRIGRDRRLDAMCGFASETCVPAVELSQNTRD